MTHRETTTENNGARPFDGLKILDATHVLAGPFCTYQMALLGADVIRVERVDGGDFIRRHGSKPSLNERGLGTSFLGQNANKRSVAIDLKTSQGRRLFLKLAEQTDVVVENFRPGVMKRLGLGYHDIRAVNSRVVYLSMTGFGQRGPLSHAPAYDHIMQAFSGVMDLNQSDADRNPTRVGFPMIDYVTGLTGAFALASALRQRDRENGSQYVDVAMMDCALSVMNSFVAQHLVTGNVVRPSAGVAFSGSPFSGYFDTAHGQLAVTANTPEQAERLCKALEHPDILRLALDADGRLDNDRVDDIRPVLCRIFLQKTATDWEVVLTDAGVPASKVRRLSETLQHPQIRERDCVLDVPHQTIVDGGLSVPGVGFVLSRGRAKATSAPPVLGEHTREVLTDLGFTMDDIAQLEAQGIVRTGAPSEAVHDL